jgi:hypothetical protein
VIVSKVMSLFDQGRWKTVSVSLVVNELRVDKVIDLFKFLNISVTKNKILGILTFQAFSRVVGRPKTKSFTDLKNG